jgi:hypothetical protein
MHPASWTVVPYTTEKKEKITAYVTSNCRGITDHTQPATSVEEWAHQRNCLNAIEDLQQGGEMHAYPSTSKYLAINATAAAVGFVIIYCLTFLLPALARRYWRWLKT